MINSRNLIYTNILDLTNFETVANLILKCAFIFRQIYPINKLYCDYFYGMGSEEETIT